MSTDVYGCVFRSRPIDALQAPSPEGIIRVPGLALTDQLHFLEVKDGFQVEFARLQRGLVEKAGHGWQETSIAYDLYGWLGCRYRGKIEAFFPNYVKRRDATEVFLDRIEEFRNDAAGEFEKAMLFSSFNDTLTAPLAPLQEFNYDQQVTARRKYIDERQSEYLARVAELEGKTYRDLFRPEWFEFLDWAKKENWTYVLYQFIQ
jgi:hypothetical protein